MDPKLRDALTLLFVAAACTVIVYTYRQASARRLELYEEALAKAHGGGPIVTPPPAAEPIAHGGATGATRATPPAAMTASPEVAANGAEPPPITPELAAELKRTPQRPRTEDDPPQPPEPPVTDPQAYGA